MKWSIVMRSHFSVAYAVRGFITKGDLKRHEAVHSDKGKEYNDSMIEDKDEKLTKTSHCKDIKVHHNEMSYQCDKCGKSYQKHSSLKKHDMSHTGEKPFQCNTCDSSFITRKQLEKPYDDTYW